MSKLHHTIAKLERIFIYGYICTFHLGIHFSFGYATFFKVGYATFWGYALSIWVDTFYLGICTFYLGMQFLFGYALFICNDLVARRSPSC